MVLAHPDDESFLGGGALTYYARRGVHSALLTFTDGQAGRMGVTGMPPRATKETIGEIRREEQRRACRLLETNELIMPGWMDGGLADVPDRKGAEFVASHIRRLRPDVLVSFGPEGAPSGHLDHKATYRWTAEAYRLAADPAWTDGGPPVEVAKYYWITWPEAVTPLRGIPGSPITAVLDIGQELGQLKRAAFDEHATQQDHLVLFGNLQDRLANKEYFHLAESRNDANRGFETDLFEGLKT